MAMQKYRVITNQIAGLPNRAIRMFNPNFRNVQTWLKLGYIEEVIEEKTNVEVINDEEKVVEPVKKKRRKKAKK